MGKFKICETNPNFEEIKKFIILSRTTMFSFPKPDVLLVGLFNWGFDKTQLFSKSLNRSRFCTGVIP